MNKVVKLRVVDGMLDIERLVDIQVLDPYSKEEVSEAVRFRGYGFGSFLLDLKVEEVDYDRDVVSFLKSSTGRQYSSMGDLFGFTWVTSPEAVNKVFHPPHITYGSLGKDLQGVPAEDCQIDYAIWQELEAALAVQQSEK